jgi:hypothetical protein
MAKYEDYAKVQQDSGENQEIKEAQVQQEEREASTPEVNWEQRYLELEKVASRKENENHALKRMVDDYITSEPEPQVKEPPEITVDKLYDNPSEVFDEQISAHPAVQRVEELEQKLARREQEEAEAKFAASHPDYTKIVSTPEFANWVAENPTRIYLAQAADAFDFSSADALFSLYKAEKGLKTATAEIEQEASIQAVSLEAPASGEPPPPQEYSRSEMVKMKTQAKQGNLEAEDYVRAHSAAYLQALSEGNVRP